MNVLDIGANLGTFSRFFEDIGNNVVAVEGDPLIAYHLRKLRNALGYCYEVFQGDIRRYKPVQKIDILWATSVLHFFLKTRSDHADLINWLGDVRAGLVFFQPPLEREYADRGWYRNYPSETFAELIAEWCGLTDIQNIGIAESGRPMFKIS